MDVTLKLTDALADRMAVIVQTHNDRTGAGVSLEEWLLLHLREVAIAEELVEEGQAIERESQKALQAAVQAKKNELMAALAVDPPAAAVVP